MFRKKKTTKKILIVEDDALLLQVLSQAFTEENFDVKTIENGLEVQTEVERFVPDLIVLDLVIPGIDGFAVLKQLKTSKTTKKIPVVILSNLADVGDVKSGKALGADQFFIKANVELKKVVGYAKKRLGV